MNSSFEELFFFLLLLVFDIASTWSRLDYFYLIGSDKNLFYGLNYKTGWMSLKKKAYLIYMVKRTLNSHYIIHLTKRHSIPGNFQIVYNAFILWVNETCP